MENSSRTRGLVVIYAATIFTSAFLLFQIQPMVSKAILPWFGGTPAVWTTCLLFFQTVLFAGYAYAHFTTTRLPRPGQALLHAFLIVVALAFTARAAGCRLATQWRRRPDAAHLDDARTHDRPAVLRALLHGPAAASLVRSFVPRPIAVSLVRPFECRLVARTAQLSIFVRAPV